MRCRAIAFDTGGTVLDWHGAAVDEIEPVEAWRSGCCDRHEFVDAWRRRTMKGIVGQVRPAFHRDDVHLRTLDETIAHCGLPRLDGAARDRLWRGWHRLRAWPDVLPALDALRERLPIVSLRPALVIDVSRRNGNAWNAIVSCQMIDLCKPDAEAYRTAVTWLERPPADVLMVACHNFDLNAAQDVGM